MSKKSILQQIGLLLGMSVGTLGGSLSLSGCTSTSAQYDDQTITEKTKKEKEPVAPQSLQDPPQQNRHIHLSHRYAFSARELDRPGDLLERERQEDAAFENQGYSTMEIGYSADSEISLEREWEWSSYRATRNAIFDRVLDKKGDLELMNEPIFPITMGFRASIKGDRSWHPLANHELIQSSRISLDNMMAAALYGIGTRQGLNDKPMYRTTALLIQLAEMLATSRAGHEFAHGFDKTVRDKNQLPIHGLLFAISDSGEKISYQDLIASQAAGLNDSTAMRIRYWQQSETRGNIVAALGFLISGFDALIQWTYGHVINNGRPEELHQKRLQSAPGIRQHLETLDEFEEDFEEKNIEQTDTLNPAIYQVTGHGDSVAYIKLLEVLGHGNAHRDKDLGILLGTNGLTAYFWQSIYEIINFVANGTQTHERWRMAGPVEWPVFSTWRLPNGYLTQARLPIVFSNEYINRVTLIGGRDLDNILGNLETTQLGAEASGTLPGELNCLRWRLGTVLSFDRKNWAHQGSSFYGNLSWNIYGPFSFTIQGAYHHNDPILRNVELEKNGFSLRMGIEIQLNKQQPTSLNIAPPPARDYTIIAHQ